MRYLKLFEDNNQYMKNTLYEFRDSEVLEYYQKIRDIFYEHERMGIVNEYTISLQENGMIYHKLILNDNFFNLDFGGAFGIQANFNELLRKFHGGWSSGSRDNKYKLVFDILLNLPMTKVNSDVGPGLIKIETLEEYKIIENAGRLKNEFDIYFNFNSQTLSHKPVKIYFYKK